MDLLPLMSRLKNARVGSRELDLEVAKVLGWTTRTESITDPNGATRDRVLWMVPGENNVTGKVPDYTTSTQAAYLVAEAFAPGHVGGCSWEPGKGSARIGQGPYVEASTPALALCIAAIMIRARQF